MNPPIKLISTDFDGTFFAEFQTPPVPDSLVSAIRELQSRGAKWVINTGRDMSSLMETLARAHLPIQPDYLVVVEREIYIHDGIRYAPHEQWNGACTRDHAELFRLVRPEVPKLMDWVNARYAATVYEDVYSPFCLIAESAEDAEAINSHLDAFCRRIPHLTVMRNDVYARFCHEGYHKGTALGELTRHLGLTSDNVFAAGDHFNDLPMLSRDFARWLVAPDNAIDEVKAAVTRQNGFVSILSQGDGVVDGLMWALR